MAEGLATTQKYAGKFSSKYGYVCTVLLRDKEALMCVYSDARGGLVEYTQQLMLANDMIGVGGEGGG